MSEKCEKEGQSYEKQETREIQSQGKVAAKRTEHARKTHLREKHEKNLSTTPDWVSTKIDLMYSCVAKSCIHSWIYCVQRRPAFLSVLFRCLEGMATCGRILFASCFAQGPGSWIRTFSLQHSASQCKSHSVQSEPKFAPPQGRFALWISSHDLGGRLKLQISLCTGLLRDLQQIQ